MKRVLVTGGSSGIGKSLVELLKQNGYEVYFTYKTHPVEGGIFLDLEDKSSIEKVVSSLPKIDILINNASTCQDMPILDKTYEVFSSVIQANLVGTFYLTQQMIKSHPLSQILFVTSTNGIDTYYPESIDYDASKAGMISMMHNFAKEFGSKIRVNAIAPGWVDTPMNENMDESLKKGEESKILLGRFAQSEEIAKVCLFLISEDASYIQDSVIRCDGGILR